MAKNSERRNGKGTATASSSRPKRRLIKDLGWTKERARKVRARLASFDEDWNAPGMEAYDEPEEK